MPRFTFGPFKKAVSHACLLTTQMMLLNGSVMLDTYQSPKISDICLSLQDAKPLCDITKIGCTPESLLS